jgi:hypothetical protein
MYHHSNDKSGIAANRGEQAEILFQQKCSALNISWTKATLYEDKMKHHDLYITSKTNKRIGIDVKSHKCRYRSDVKPDQKYCFLELSNNYGYSWIDGTGYLGFQFNDKFYLVYRKDLQEYVNNTINLNQVKIENKERPYMNEDDLAYKLFYRDNQPREIVTLVPWEDIKRLAKKII